MWSVEDLIRLVSVFFNLVSGLTLNAYIISVYVREWRKRKAINTCDKIVLFLALSGIIYQCTSTIEGLIFCLRYQTPHGRSESIYAIVCNIFLMCGSFWNTAWLSIYYCLKLVKCSHHIFLQIKRRLSSSIMHLLFISLVGLFFLSLPLPWTLHFNFVNTTEDSSGIHNYVHINVPYVPFYMVIGSLLPFLLIFICIGLSVKSLLIHVQQIRHNSSQFSSSPQLEGHLRAVRTMILQVCLCLALYLAVFSIIHFSLKIGVIVRIFFCTILASYPSFQAVISIQGNPKLRNRPLTRDTTTGSK